MARKVEAIFLIGGEALSGAEGVWVEAKGDRDPPVSGQWEERDIQKRFQEEDDLLQSKGPFQLL